MEWTAQRGGEDGRVEERGGIGYQVNTPKWTARSVELGRWGREVREVGG